MRDNVLIVAPHADDEVLGCGGFIQYMQSKGAKIYVAIMTNAHIGAPELFSYEDVCKVRDEAKRAHRLLKITETFFYDFPAPVLDQFPNYKISNALFSLVSKLGITTVCVPHRGDIHKDHRAVFEAALVACRPINGILVRKVMSYETLSETEWAPPFGDDAFIPNVFYGLSNEQMNVKLEAMRYYESQLKSPPSPRSLEIIKALGQFRGATVEQNYAEAFMMIRDIH